MDSSHVAAGVGGSSLTAMLATVIQYYQGVQDLGVANAEAGIAVVLIGATGAWLRWYFAERLGGAPPSIVNGMNVSKEEAPKTLMAGGAKGMAEG